ncbi:NADH dehydrogenase [ubiquinone] 1 alpha subcomplex assembly factor 4-like [Styela clava]|uniref:NADH dehydrogenase [ubiquinone] 1 alpha subcomplex assembly factor 4-like n=1 Tax=Styela clava TaxID=7725 RepID=UPI00193A1048|nr:NADH dehydrogenase [ubiquinone] 1 alpha subcomplex assembly factor 4-like [Styela clava]
MGGSNTKITQAATQFQKVNKVVKEGVDAVQLHGMRKIKNQSQQYNAEQKMDKYMEKELENPKRAPMNLSKIEIPDDIRAQKLSEARSSQEEDKSYLNMIKDVYLTSEDPKQEPYKVVNSKERKLPQSKTLKTGNLDSDVPRGRAKIQKILEAMHNHKIDPIGWGPAELAEKIRIRESDMKDILDNFDLVRPSDLILEEDPSKKLESGAYGKYM